MRLQVREALIQPSLHIPRPVAVLDELQLHHAGITRPAALHPSPPRGKCDHDSYTAKLTRRFRFQTLPPNPLSHLATKALKPTPPHGRPMRQMTQPTTAHFQTLAEHETLRLWVPEHQPRTADPAYKLFNQAKRRMKQLQLPCWRCGVVYPNLNTKPLGPSTQANPLGACQLEAHHMDLEFSLLNGVDVEQWWAKSTAAADHWENTPDGDGFIVEAFSHVDHWLDRHPEYRREAYPSDEAWHNAVFDAYMESEGNLMQLCDVCHRSTHQGIHHINFPDWRPLAIWRRDLPAHVQ